MNLVPPPLKPAFFRLKFNDMAKAVLHQRFELSPARAALITGPIVFSLGHGTSLQARLEIAHAFLPSAVVEQNHCHHGKFRSLTDFCREKTLSNCFLGRALSLTVAKPYKIWEVQSRGLSGAHICVPHLWDAPL
jgi:hypothetical protein